MNVDCLFKTNITFIASIIASYKTILFYCKSCRPKEKMIQIVIKNLYEKTFSKLTMFKRKNLL